MPDRRTALVRMELIGEPTITPDGQSIQLARFPWQRPTDASHGISLNDIVEIDANGLQEQMRMAREIMETDRNMLRDLANG